MGMKLAFAFGESDVDAFLERLTSDQFNEWSAYFSIDPFGGERGVLQKMASAIVNALGGRTTPADFALELDSDEPEQKSPVDSIARAMMAAGLPVVIKQRE